MWEKQAVPLISPAKPELQTHWETPSQQMKGKAIHERDQYQPLASTCTTLQHTKTCASIHMKKKKENKHLRCTQEQGQIMTRLTSFQQHSPRGTLFLVHDSQLVK